MAQLKYKERNKLLSATGVYLQTATSSGLLYPDLLVSPWHTDHQVVCLQNLPTFVTQEHRKRMSVGVKDSRCK